MKSQNLLNHLKSASAKTCVPETVDNGNDQIRIIR